MNSPKPTPHEQNWQVQTLDGAPVSDHRTEDRARIEAILARVELQRPVRVRRTA